MKLSRKMKAGVGILLAVFVLLIYLFPAASRISSDIHVYQTRVAYRDDYRLHTTPLVKDVVDDICLNFHIQETSENCTPNAVVYAPDFFDEIKTYFKNIPAEQKTYETVQSVLETYLIRCEPPDPDGNYVCDYDLKGDEVYPISFFFNKHGFYYRIMARTGGS